MARYLLSVWHADEPDFDFESEDAQRLMEQVGAFNTALIDSGAFLTAGGLNPANEAVVFDAEGTRTTGLYDASETMMGGFWLIDVEGPEQAEDWTKRAAAACEGNVELRRLNE